jgi:hypothetical protein
VNDFVGMENDLAGELCTAVNAALVALKTVIIFRNENSKEISNYYFYF